MSRSLFFLLIASLISPSIYALCAPTAASCISSLDTLSIAALRNRQYESRPSLAKQLSTNDRLSKYAHHYSLDGTAPFHSYIVSYQSDLRMVYARLDIPSTAMPAKGYPVIIFAHGWVGQEKAHNYNFGYDLTSLTGELINEYVDAGFMVITPGYIGHGTVDGVQAGGFEIMQSWDNATYLAPTFYAIDLLNLLEGLSFLNSIDWKKWAGNKRLSPKVNLSAINLTGHSQGGDVALTALAVSGEDSGIKNTFAAASIWSGNIPARFTQLETFAPMATTLQAFVSGDGSWTGTEKGSDNSINPNFIFPWPSDFIGTLDTASPNWTWQSEQWSQPNIESVLRSRYKIMYDRLVAQVVDLEALAISIDTNEKGKLIIKHPPELETKMLAIGGFDAAQFLTEPLLLHYSDRDYYSIPSWNQDLAKRINQQGGKAKTFIYNGNTHGLKRSQYSWFSPDGTADGFPQAIKRDILLFAR
jgi:dienelactone hydrolase